MKGELIAIGDELTSGRILNTTSYFAASKLFAAGHEICAMVTIGDEPGLIGRTIIDSLSRADFLIVTGGLGVTSDDITNEAVSHALDRPTTFYPDLLRAIRENSRDVPEPLRLSLEKLAWLPAGAHVLSNEVKSAGHFLVHEGKPIFFLPGVPHEMEELLVETVITRLAVWEGEEPRQVRQRLYRTLGRAEAEINRLLAVIEDEEGARIGYYPVFPEVHVSLTVAVVDPAAADALLSALDRRIREKLGASIFGIDDETLEEVVGRLLAARGATLSLAESCTGGLVSSRITRVAGSSAWFRGGVVAYANEVKNKALGVAEEIIVAHGAVSEQCARAMAAGARELTGSDYAVSITGIAGPSGGSAEKPVGTVCFAFADHGGIKTETCHFSGERWQVQEAAAAHAMNRLRLILTDGGEVAG